ncbi:MAG: DMT family transporter [Pseudomonadota bacterium]
MSLSANHKGALLGLAAFAAFSTHDVIVKELGATYSPFQIVFFSALLSFPLISIILIQDQKPGTLRPVHPYWIAVRSVSATASAVCAFYAFSTLPLSQVYAFVFSAPLLITLLAIPMLGEKIRLRRGLALVVGLIGVLVVIQPGSAPLELGHLAAFLSACTGALNSVIVRKIGNEERRVVMILYPMMANLLLSAMVLPFVYVAVPIVDLGLFAVVSFLVLLAMVLLVAAYSSGDAIIVAPMQYSQIIWGALFGILLFQEYPEWQTYLGTAIIVVSGIYILKREATADVSENSPVLNTKTRSGHTMALRVSLLRRLLRRKK